MQKLKIGVMVVFLTLVFGISRGQDPAFSQFYANPLYLNPAMAGNTYCGRLALNFRNQWPSISQGYITYNASYDQYLEKINSGYGIMFTGDRQGEGALSTMVISGLYSYKLMVSESVNVGFGIQATYNQMKIDWNKFVFEDMIDPNTGLSNLPTGENPANWNTNVTYVDFSAGAMVGVGDKFYGGFAVHHLNQPDNGLHMNSESTLSMKITAHAGTQINLMTGQLGSIEEGDIGLSPNILYQQQGQFQQLNFGLYTSINPFVGGLWFRHNFENPDAVIALVGFKQPNYQIGYSYDFTISDVGISAGGAHEISFVWEFCIYREDFKRRKIRTIKSPTF